MDEIERRARESDGDPFTLGDIIEAVGRRSYGPLLLVIGLFAISPAIVIAAALITFPLSLVPFAPLAPGIAVVFFGLGMVARDGLWLVLGAAALAGAFWLGWTLIF